MNDQLQEQDVAIVDSTRWEAIQHILKYQEKIKRRYNRWVKLWVFNLEDWVLKKVVRLHEQGKLDDN